MMETKRQSSGTDEPTIEWDNATASESARHGASHVDAASDSGRQFGRFLLLELLGRGGMGEVYRAVHVNLKKTVALKILSGELLSNERAVARFHREICAISALSHPNIVRFENAGEEEGMPFLVMEFVPGIDFEQLVSGLGSLPLPDACQIVAQAALGLHHAHMAGLVHRDVKPSNLILAATGTVKVLDLGLAFLTAMSVTSPESSFELADAGRW